MGLLMVYVRATLTAVLLWSPATIAESKEAVPLDDLELTRISGHDQLAVARETDGEIYLLRVGDSIGAHGVVTEITNGRVVIETVEEGTKVLVIISLEDGRQTLMRIGASPAGSCGPGGIVPSN